MAVEAGQAAQKDRAAGQVSLFEFSDSFSTDARKMPDVAKLGSSEILSMEKEMLGFYVSGHPLMRYEGMIAECTNASTTTLDNREDGDPITIAGMISGVRHHITKTDKRMAFVSMEDLEGSVDLVVFAEVLEKCSDAIQEGNIVWVKGDTGNGRADRDTPSIRVDEILTIDEARKKLTSSVHVHIPPKLVESNTLESLKEIFSVNKGDCTLFLHFKTDQYEEVVVQAHSETNVAPTDELISQIEQIVGERSVSLVGSNGNGNGASTQKRRGFQRYSRTASE